MLKLIPLMILAPAFASAAIQTNQILTPALGQSEVNLGLEYRQSNVSSDSTVGPITASGNLWRPTVSYNYGLTDDHTVGAELSYNSGKSSTEIEGFDSENLNISGLETLSFRYQGKMQVGAPHLYWSASYVLPAEKSRTEDESANAAPAQSSLDLKGGVLMQLPVGTIGFLLESQMRQNGKEVDASGGTDSESTVKKGNGLNLEAFMEFDQAWKPNVALLLNRRYSSISVDEFGDESSSAGFTEIGARVMTRHYVSPQLEILPQLTLLKLQAADIVDEVEFKKSDSVYIGVIGRFLF